MSKEYILLGKANDEYIKLSKSIIATATAKAKMTEMENLSTKALDLSMKAAGKLMEIQNAEAETDYVDPFSGEIIKQKIKKCKKVSKHIVDYTFDYTPVFHHFRSNEKSS